MRGLTCRQSLLSRQEMMFRRWASCGTASWPASTMTAEWAVDRAPLNFSLSKLVQDIVADIELPLVASKGRGQVFTRPVQKLAASAPIFEIRDKAIAAKRAADAQGRRSSDLGDPTRRRSNPDPDGPEEACARSGGIEDRKRRATQEKLNALVSSPVPPRELSEAAKKLYRGT